MSGIIFCLSVLCSTLSWEDGSLEGGVGSYGGIQHWEPPPLSISQHAHTHTHTHTIHTHRIDRAVSRVYRLAMQDFTNPRLASSCAAFIEMVDRDSTLLRVDLQAALRIARHGHQQQQQGQRAWRISHNCWLE